MTRKTVKSAKVLGVVPPVRELRFGLFPTGLYWNRELQTVKEGKIVSFWRDWAHDDLVLVRKTEISVNSTIFGFMAKLIYGDKANIRGILSKWRREAQREGASIDESRCLLCEFREMTEEERYKYKIK